MKEVAEDRVSHRLEAARSWAVLSGRVSQGLPAVKDAPGPKSEAKRS